MPLRALVLACLLVLLHTLSAFAQALPTPAPAAAAAVNPPNITVTNLGTLYPGYSTEPRAINEHGVVAGSAIPQNDFGVAFIWTPGEGFREIAQRSFATDINNHNEVVGVRGDCENPCTGWLWTAETGISDLGTFIPYAINDAGAMAGACPRVNATPVPCVRIDGQVQEIPLTPRDGLAFDINIDGVVAGWGYRPVGQGGRAPYAFVWSVANGLQLLDQGGAEVSEASAINASGVVAGMAGARLALWRDAAAQVQQSTDTRAASAAGLNDLGVVVGTAALGAGGANRPVMWVPGERVRELPAPRGLSGWYAAGVNSSSRVVGAARDGSGLAHALLWTVTLAPPLHITTPNVPAKWGLATRQRLAWTYAGLAPRFQIEISRADDEPWELLDIVPNRPGHSNNYYWTVTGPATATARLRVTGIGDPAAVDVNDADVRIAPAAVQVLTPQRRDATPFGSTQRIFVTHNLGAGAPVAIDVSGDGGVTWRTVTETRTNGSTTASFAWTVDIMQATRARVRVRALDGSGAAGVSAAFPIPR